MRDRFECPPILMADSTLSNCSPTDGGGSDEDPEQPPSNPKGAKRGRKAARKMQDLDLVSEQVQWGQNRAVVVSVHSFPRLLNWTTGGLDSMSSPFLMVMKGSDQWASVLNLAGLGIKKLRDDKA